MTQFLIDLTMLAGVLIGYAVLFTLIPLLVAVGVLRMQEVARGR